MARAPSRVRGLAGVSIAALLLGCFSTMLPERDEPGGPEDGDPNTAIVRGLVLLRMGPGDFRQRADWHVDVQWYQGAGLTVGNRIGSQILTSNRSGVYEARLKDPRVKRAVLRPFDCSVNPADLDFCCLSRTNPCDCHIWDTARVVEVTIGMVQNGENLVTNCPDPGGF